MAESGVVIDNELLERLERLAIHWQKSLPGLVGGHNTSRYTGSGQEFLDHRHFHHGDDVRDVNWRAFLRLEKLFLKMFQLEPRIPVRIMVDISKSMMTGGDNGDTSKFDYARKLAAALCYVGLVRLESICLNPFSNKLGDAFVVAGGRHRIQPAVRFLTTLTPGGHTDFFTVVREFISRYPQRGVTFVISDFLDDADCEKPLQYLADFGHELILIQLWSEADREPPWDGELELEDAETGRRVELPFGTDVRTKYTGAFDEYSAHLRGVALRNGGRYVGLSTAVPIEEAIFGPILRTGAIQ
ncbi:MAG TPA: DUF58 domain-containing protein [Bryobacteraceae bacterium]|nr:DUF58 domain-containing protein [Bryobacteraceae bacterium]